MKLTRMINLTQDENVALRAEIYNLEVEFHILDESYKQFLLVSIGYGLFHGSNRSNRSDQAIVFFFLC